MNTDKKAYVLTPSRIKETCPIQFSVAHACVLSFLCCVLKQWMHSSRFTLRVGKIVNFRWCGHWQQRIALISNLRKATRLNIHHSHGCISNTSLPTKLLLITLTDRFNMEDLTLIELTTSSHTRSAVWIRHVLVFWQDMTPLPSAIRTTYKQNSLQVSVRESSTFGFDVILREWLLVKTSYCACSTSDLYHQSCATAGK